MQSFSQTKKIKMVELIKKLIVLVFVLRVASYRFPYNYDNDLIASAATAAAESDSNVQAKGNDEAARSSPLLNWWQTIAGSHLLASGYKIPKQQNPFVGVNVDIFVDPEKGGVKMKSYPLDNGRRRPTSAGNELASYLGNEDAFTSGLRDGIEFDVDAPSKRKSHNDLITDEDLKQFAEMATTYHPDRGGNDINNDDEKYLNSNWNTMNKRQMDWMGRWRSGGGIGHQPRPNSDDEPTPKRNALLAFKRLKGRPRQMQFVPSISVESMSNLGGFFKDLADNMKFLEKSQLSQAEMKLMDGDHPVSALRDEILMGHNSSSSSSKPTATAAFLSAVRHYKPSEKVSTLVAMNPEGYHSSQFIDPNYHWIGMGK